MVAGHRTTRPLPVNMDLLIPLRSGPFVDELRVMCRCFHQSYHLQRQCAESIALSVIERGTTRP